MADAEATAAAPCAAPSYDRIAQAVHWLVAALAVTVIWLGWGIAWAPRNTPRRDLFVLIHESVGLTILAAMVFRAWWRRRHPPPPLPPGLSRLETGLAGLTHFAMYLLLIMMPLAGYSSTAAAGRAVSYFGVFSIPPLMPGNDRLSQVAIAIHLVGQYPLYVFVALHIAGALFHGFVRRDGVVERMLPLRRWPIGS
ncbi:MAG: cytochrome b [Alphaproteobacteria bacterium]|nr:MAG: cytochrome b [Alphaproteobacteria bacterium]